MTKSRNANEVPEPPDRPRIVLGAMSGTSADGVDVAAVEVSGRGLGMAAKYVGHVEHPYEGDLRKRIFALRESGATRLDELAGLGRAITLAYAAAVRELLKQLSLDPRSVAGLAAHGQTLYHAPPETIQWLDPSLLAAETDLAVISDFRRADLAAGGQGAPLVPFADWILFRHPEKTRVILNIGGIANLTYLPAGGGIEDVIAFDTGPGNCWSDWLVRQYFPDGSGVDEGGELASCGAVLVDLLDGLVEQDYFRRPPPKSTDIPTMLQLWEETRNQHEMGLPRASQYVDSAEDLLATAAKCVGLTIAGAIDSLPLAPSRIYVAGGGSRNPAIINNIAVMDWEPCRPIHVVPIDKLKVPSQAREAVAFAILGAATLDNEPSNVPSATGARRRVVLGSVTPRPGG